MEPEIGTEFAADDASTEAAEVDVTPGPDSTAGEAPAQQSSSINPAWVPMRDILGEDIFDVNVAPHLQKFDEAANSRITNLNTQLKSYEGYKQFVDQGVSPEDLQMTLQFRQLLESDPQSVYQMLGNHLGQNGEQQQEGFEEFGSEQENAMEIPPHLQAKLEQLEQFQQQQLQQQQDAQQQQFQQQQIHAAGQQLDQEMSSFLQNNPSFTDNDTHELFRMQHELTKQLEASGVSRMATLEEAAAAVNDRANYYKQRSGGVGAPNTLPTTAGGDIPGQRPDVGKMSKQSFEQLIANDLQAAKARQS